MGRRVGATGIEPMTSTVSIPSRECISLTRTFGSNACLIKPGPKRSETFWIVFQPNNYVSPTLRFTPSESF